MSTGFIFIQGFFVLRERSPCCLIRFLIGISLYWLHDRNVINDALDVARHVIEYLANPFGIFTYGDQLWHLDDVRLYCRCYNRFALSRS